MHQSASSQTPPSSSPFTNAPLPQRTHISPPPHHTAQQQPYGAYAYPYSAYAGYSGYTAFSARPPAKATPVVSAPSTSAKTIAPPTKTATKTVISAVTGKDKDSLVAEEGSDAWVAAQHILKAINFGSLQDNSASAVGTVSTLSPSQPMAGSSHIIQPPVMASLGIDVHATSEDDGLGRATLTDEERASLQAQLALLAAQLSEIAAEEDIEEEHAIREDEEIARQAQQPHAASPSIIIAPEEKQGPNPNIVLDVNQFPDSAEPLAKSPTSDPPSVQDGNTGSLPILTTGSLQYPRGSEELTGPSTAPSHSAPVPDIAEESDDDEDMEMVDVDSYMLSSKGIQT
ncbi:hypothetical protein BDY19DRAFT_219418 [Irpex rosettiformis]|uniref:Uncharacterized protein n=1 Tax=Irpex rosettiformis TaxID=378272 RepID=A0ACB8U0H5_9APHY|nr:hypothetical protein BDY19DRAFT_219418 [Irpex rosettiformis]